jgi:hypothetical protein
MGDRKVPCYICGVQQQIDFPNKDEYCGAIVNPLFKKGFVYICNKYKKGMDNWKRHWEFKNLVEAYKKYLNKQSR